MKPDPERLKPLLNLPVPDSTASLRRILRMFAHYSKWVPKFSEKIQPLAHSTSFPLSEKAISPFRQLKQDIANSSISLIDDDVVLTVETDASEFAITAQLSQSGRPVSFFFKNLILSRTKAFFSCKRSVRNSRSTEKVATFFNWQTFSARYGPEVSGIYV